MLTPEWRKSSYSNGQASCVEVRLGTPDAVAVRDSKHRTGPELAVTATAWSEFIGDIKHGDFDMC
jgi:hypothetical protein